jgi:hypothetical protein
LADGKAMVLRKNKIKIVDSADVKKSNLRLIGMDKEIEKDIIKRDNKIKKLKSRSKRR